MNVKRRSLAKRETTTRNVLIGTAVVGALGTLYLLTRGSSTPQKNLALGAPYSPYAAGPTDCSSYLPSSLSPTDEGTSGTADALASYGACAGQNALVAGIFNSSIVQSIESAIEQGTVESAQLIGLATLALQAVSLATGLSVAAATSVMPIVGAVLTAVLAIADWISSLGGGPQIYVPNPNASGSDSLNVAGLGMFEKINLSDYGGFIQNAMNWVHANPTAALSTTPQQLSNQFSIFLDSTVPGQLSTNNQVLFALAGSNSSQNVYQQLANGNPVPPGAYEILRSVQLPAAAAVCASMPIKVGYLTNNGGSGGMGTAPLQTQFPALTTADMAAIFATQSLTGSGSPYATAIQQAQGYVSAQCPPLMDPTVLVTKYSLALQDAVHLLTQWVPVQPCPGYQAPIAVAGPQQCMTTSFGILGSQQVCLPGPLTILPGSSAAGFAAVNTGGNLLTNATIASSSSAAGTVVKSAAVVAGAAGAVLIAYKLYTGYSFLKTAQGAWGDLKKGAGYVKGKLTGRKSNPISVFPYRTSATGGRIVAYRVRLFSRYEEILFNGQRAELIRHGKKVAGFKPSSFQKAKIRAGRGEVLIFQDQLER
jgi:hypothetical protein